MTGFEAIIGLAGTALSALGSIAAGNQQAAAMEAQAKAQERQGAEERAATHREAAQRAKEARLVLSRQQAVASASGGGASDPTVMGLMSDTAAQGEFNTRSAVYEGEARWAGLMDQAAISRMQAKQAKMAGFINAGSTMLSGISGFAKSWNAPSTMPTYRYS